ncbi:hypothetical protein LVB87_15170 [Lysobacter sp. KIS68-7]|uniref:hypothetical protein n=1 Tax=Lysobacter sp. KIS68-7 TaxID=2904252 RepID=UPI001E41492F|nr:hypothetical protein [Lysobacter sp. KIS68-7]UHQ19508.1 hypothetical protein LVB87_15170 [Lysobacter sp. KIS68-7]
MNLSEFKWYVVGPTELGLTGLHLRRGGERGQLIACVAGMEGEQWVAVLGLHDDRVRARIWCASETQAIEAVEDWLAAMLTAP